MFTETTRPLTPEERAEFESRRDELQRRKAAEAASSRRNDRAAAAWMALFAAFFLAIVIFNLVSGTKSAALAALVGVIFFGALVVWMLRSNDYSSDTREIELLSLTLDTNTVRVYEIRAEGALSIGPHEPEDKVWGDLLQVGPDEVVYVSRSTCGPVDEDLLPNTALYVEWAVPFGVTKIEARGARIATALQVRLSGHLYYWIKIPPALEPFVPVELARFPGDVAALARSLPDQAPTG